MTYRKKLIEVALPLDAINAASAREKSVPRKGHPGTLHLWWARRPLAACRAVLFAQLVDDPSSWPDIFPGEEEQDQERRRIFGVLEALVKWENTRNEQVLAGARREIALSHARATVATSQEDEASALAVLGDPSDVVVRRYLADRLPTVLDPFCGGGSIPAEAVRLGLAAAGTDLNPVPVMVGKALLEFPQAFRGRPAVSQREGQKSLSVKPGDCNGLAEDIRTYGRMVTQRASELVGHLYETVTDATGDGTSGTPMLWFWVRTVESPNPAFRGIHVPLASTFTIVDKPKRRIWIEPTLVRSTGRFEFKVRTGHDGSTIPTGTVNRSGAKCLASGDPIDFAYIRDQAQQQRLGMRLMAIAIEARPRVYVSPTSESEDAALSAQPSWRPQTSLPEKALSFRVQRYGMSQHQMLFAPRQLAVLAAFGDAILWTRAQIERDATARISGDAAAYANAVTTYLQLAHDKMVDWNSSLCSFIKGYEKVRNTFSRHALPMVWDFVETNPFSSSVGNWMNHIEWVARAVEDAPVGEAQISVQQRDAAKPYEPNERSKFIICTDPPYYDNIGYGDLSDFFYVWMRRTLGNAYPELFSTLLVPKSSELIATPFRHQSKREAEEFFVAGMKKALDGMAYAQADDFPLTLFYAFKQAEVRKQGIASTGWETFLRAVIDAGFTVTATWPIRTERASRAIGLGTNALASSIVLSCRKRDPDAPVVRRAQYRRTLRRELPASLDALEKSNIAPVDMAQAIIGPGIALFSMFGRVLESDDSAMSVRSALELVNAIVDEIRGEEEGELDSETRFAVTWFGAHAYEAGPFGDAETLAKARNVSVAGVAAAGVLSSGGNRVRLHSREQLPADWDPATDQRLTVWEATQHFIKRLDSGGEAAAAGLMSRVGGVPGGASVVEAARLLAYRLYTICEQRNWAEEAGAYNRLVVAWPEIARLAVSRPASKTTVQQELL